ncbi:MAG: amino acid ABC transporter permease [Actinobacteria bacterium]|nr:amino acid ABC transporter permease [Actinomycetota bacterium]
MSTTPLPDEREAAPPIRAIPARHPWRWVAAAIVLIIGAFAARSVVTNPRFGWSTVWEYMFADTIMRGLVITIELTIISMVLGVILGIILAVMKLSPNKIVSGASELYIWFFRGTPLLVQVIFWFNLAALYPVISFGIPWIGPTLWEGSANVLITQFTAAVLGLALNEGAYMAEIVRGGIISVEEGQTEAAQSIGMTRGQTLRRIVLPQAMRVIVPPTGNETISMLKNTSIISVIGYAELLYSAQIIYSRTYETIPLLVVASLWYLILTTVMYVGQYYIERHFSKGAMRNLPPTPFQRLRTKFTGVPA